MTTKDEELKERIGELADIATNNYALYADLVMFRDSARRVLEGK